MGCNEGVRLCRMCGKEESGSRGGGFCSEGCWRDWTEDRKSDSWMDPETEVVP